MSEILLARYADAIFWLGRYIERAENLARILDVNETFSRDAAGGQNWLSIIQLLADTERFFAKHAAARSDTVLSYYVLDFSNPASVASCVRQARENARTLRPLISTEMWMHLNIFHNWVSTLGPADIGPGRVNALCGRIKEACQAHTGIAEGTFFRDQAWYFYQIGRYLERADQTTRLLDMKYHLLLPSPEAVGSPIDVSQWYALLRSAAGYHAFRRLHPRGMTPAQVAGFLLLNRRFPRSVYLCVREAEMLLSEAKSRYGLRGGAQAAELLDGLRAELSSLGISEILAGGLHEFLDFVQLRLNRVSEDLAVAFFGYLPAAPGGSAAAAQ
ncbi:MAG TPA: alpha-E domain-containing protein [Acetobacteraceae bacterium]|nr:alpha-E domain-containing protein [Acetobacteraceae bacterium]